MPERNPLRFARDQWALLLSVLLLYTLQSVYHQTKNTSYTQNTFQIHLHNPIISDVCWNYMLSDVSLCLLLTVIPSYCHVATTTVFEKPRITPISLWKKPVLCLLIVIKIKVQICQEAIKCPLGPAWSCSGLHLNFFSTYLTPTY